MADFEVTLSTDTDLYNAYCSCGFTSSGWTRERDAKQRMLQHLQEHKSSEPMPELADYPPFRHLIPEDV